VGEAMTSDAQRIDQVLVEKAQETYRCLRSQLEYFGATEYDGPDPMEAALRVVFDELGLEVKYASGFKQVRSRGGNWTAVPRYSLSVARECVQRDGGRVESRLVSNWRPVEDQEKEHTT
jgi:hypothetical protein